MAQERLIDIPGAASRANLSEQQTGTAQLPEQKVTAFEKVLVPTDFSCPSLRALSYAEALAGREIQLVHVVEPNAETWPPEVFAPPLLTQQVNLMPDAD